MSNALKHFRRAAVRHGLAKAKANKGGLLNRVSLRPTVENYRTIRKMLLAQDRCSHAAEILGIRVSLLASVLDRLTVENTLKLFMLVDQAMAAAEKGAKEVIRVPGVLGQPTASVEPVALSAIDEVAIPKI